MIALKQMAEKKEKTEEKSEKKETEKKIDRKKNNNIKYLIIAVILIIAIVFIYPKYFPKTTPQTGMVIANVNGENITLSELNKVYDSMPAQIKTTTSKKSLLNQMIEARLLYQEAKRQGITIEKEEAQQYIKKIKLSGNFNDEQFTQLLAQQNITEEELITQYIKQSTTQALLNETVLSKIRVSDEEIKDYYNKNKESFKVKEQITVRHILIGDKNLTSGQQNETAAKLLKEITKDNFCDYVEKYSTDKASLPNCGEYTFTKDDPLVQEFKDFSFSGAIGEIGIVKTQFGFHIIWVVKKTPARILPFDEVKDKIKESLASQKAQGDYKKFYEKLLQRSVINIYYKE